MKKMGAATIRNIVVILLQWIILNGISVLTIRFIQNYRAVGICYFTLFGFFLFTFAFAQKRVVNLNIHDRKFALFTCGTGHGLIT